MKIILDFDRTLFAVERLYSALEALGKPHLAGTAESFKVLPIENYVYEDVRPFLRTKNQADVLIVSSASGTTGEWETDYQAEKITASGVAALVGEVRIVRGEKGAVVAEIAQQFPPTEPLIFVDDRLEQCLSVRAAVPRVTCCLMVRDVATIGNVETVRGLPVVHSLAEVDAIIETI